MTIDASNLTILKLPDRAIVLGSDYFTYGQINLASMSDRYNFDIKPNPNNDFWIGLRNFGTNVGRWYSGEGTGFNINFTGNPTIIDKSHQ